MKSIIIQFSNFMGNQINTFFIDPKINNPFKRYQMTISSQQMFYFILIDKICLIIWQPWLFNQSEYNMFGNM